MVEEKSEEKKEVSEEEAKMTQGFPVKYTVSKQYTRGRIQGAWYDNEEELEDAETEGVIEVLAFPEGVQPAHVSATMGLTMNLGDYESAKISVTTTLPCYVEEIDDAYEAAKNYSGMKMLAERDFIKETVAKKKRS